MDKENAKTFALWRNFYGHLKHGKQKLIKWLHDFNPDLFFLEAM